MLLTVAVLLTLVYQHFRGRAWAKPQPTRLSSTSGIQTPRQESLLPDRCPNKNDEECKGGDQRRKLNKQRQAAPREATCNEKERGGTNINLQQQRAPISASSVDIDAIPIQPTDMPDRHITEVKERVAGEKQVISNPISSIRSEEDVPIDSNRTNDQVLEHHIEELKEEKYSSKTYIGDVITARGELHGGEPTVASAFRPGSRLHSTVGLNQPSSIFDSETTRKEVAAKALGISYRNDDVGVLSMALPSVHRPLPLQPPHPDLRFNKLLIDLNQMITSQDDLNIMKDVLQSEIGKRVLGNITEPRMLFKIMRERGLISRNNIIWLQALLKELNNEELVRKTIDYCCQNTNDVLFLQQVTDTPANGYRDVNFHVHLDTHYNNGDLRILQMRVADILCVEAKFVLLKSVKPTNSLLITLMVPELYVSVLMEYLDHPQSLVCERFAALGIDTITIDDNVNTLEVCQEVEPKESDQQQMVSLYHQLSKRDIQLEGMENRCNQMEQTIVEMEKQKADLTSELSESDEKRKDLMSKVALLESKVESRDAQIEALENVCKNHE